MQKVFSKGEMTDFELVEQIKQSDEQAFQLLYSRYWKALYAFAFSFTSDEAISKDIVQEIWIKFWELRCKIFNGNIKSYLYKMVRNRVYTELKSNKKLDAELSIIDKHLSVNNISDITDLADTNKLLEGSISKLPERNREIFILSRFDGLSNKEISEKLDISKRTVENHITTSLRHLRKSALMAILFATPYF